MSVCLCYHDEQNFLHERGVCYGTKEKEPCSCGGNPIMCDFYEEVREKYIHRTNADQIRSMTDEELAEWLDDVCKAAYDEGYTKESNEPLMSPHPSTASSWIDLLKQEADNG